MKYNFLKLYFMVFHSFLIGIQSFAQTWESQYFFKNLSADDGLSNPTVNSICQDSRAFMWIGTIDGLNRYDGNQFVKYHNNPLDSNSIPSNRINYLYADSTFNLWIATSEGLCKFNYKSETFTNYRTNDDDNWIKEICHDQKHQRMWLATYDGHLKYLDLKSGVIKKINSELIDNGIANSLALVNDDLYIGTTKSGIFRLDLNSLVVENFCSTKSGHFNITNNWINALHYFDENLFICTDGGGLIVYNFKRNIPEYYNVKNSGLASDYISSITHDNAGNIFMGLEIGMAVYSTDLKVITCHLKEEGNKTSLSSNKLRAMYVDINDDLWVGTFQKGVDFNYKKSRKMLLAKKKFTDKNSLSGNNVSSFAQDHNNGIWVGTIENGLNYYIDGKYSFYNEDNTDLSDDNITDMAIDNQGVFWVSTWTGGLNMFKNGKFKSFMHDPSNKNSIQSDRIRAIGIDKKGSIWLATYNGLESFDTESKIFTHHFLDSGKKVMSKRKSLRSLLVASDHKIYAGTDIGLYVYDPDSGSSEHYRNDPNDNTSLGHEIIIYLFEDSKKRIWLGTLGGGLILYNQKNNTFKSYNQTFGLYDNSIKSIEEDEHGNLWLGTNKGIVRFTPSTEKVVIFGESYGIQNNQFNINASLKCNDGRLIFGGLEGFNVLKPGDLSLVTRPINVAISDLKIIDQSIHVNDVTGILNQDISLTQEVELSYTQSKHFSISFSALQYADPDQVQYAYLLEGFDNDWNYINSETKVTFTSLEPKKYVFKVKASTNGQWNNNIKEFGINIPAPWHMTLWFRILVVLLLIALSIVFYYYKVHFHKERQLELEKLVNKKNYEITSQNEELLSSNEELSAQNEEVVRQKEYIDQQNIELQKAYGTLEERVAMRTLELNESNRKLNKSVKELDRFVYSASHDLSAPLKSVLGLVNIAKLESKEKNLDIHLDYIEKSIKKQDRVIKSLIQYSRNSKMDLKIVPIKFSELVEQVISELKYIPRAELVDMLNLVSKDISIRSDEQRIKTILNNLLSNGINYSDPNKNDSFVKIQFTKTEQAWQLKVKDNGQGIPEDQQDKIFEMFHRANEESDGSGLGLFIVKESVERLKGTVSLTSTIGEGTKFVLNFPINYI